MIHFSLKVNGKKINYCLSAISAISALAALAERQGVHLRHGSTTPNLSGGATGEGIRSYGSLSWPVVEGVTLEVTPIN